MSKIPIKNIYYMVLYAWSKVKDLSSISEKGIEGSKDFNGVIIELFLTGVHKIIQRGIYKDYINIEEESRFIKGKVDVAGSIKLIHPNMACHFDEYREDIVLNWIVKTILLRIVSLIDISNEHKKRARILLLYFSNVKSIMLNGIGSNNIIFNRFNKEYKSVIDMGMLIYKNSIPTGEKGNYRFIDIIDDEEQMSSIFEEFLRKFYEIHSSFKVNKKYYNFTWEAIESSDMNLLPRMETDIELTLDKQKIIIDAKYYRNAFSSKYEGKKLISNNIYQMKAYLTQNLDQYETLRGIIIYPSNGYTINEKFLSKMGYTMEFRTIDLNMEWENIKDRLLDFIS